MTKFAINPIRILYFDSAWTWLLLSFLKFQYITRSWLHKPILRKVFFLVIWWFHSVVIFFSNVTNTQARVNVLKQGWTTQISWGPNGPWGGTHPRAKVVMFEHIQRVFSIKERSKINKIWGFAGQIKSFCGPHLARGPYVVHACESSLTVQIRKLEKTKFGRIDSMSFLRQYQFQIKDNKFCHSVDKCSF